MRTNGIQPQATPMLPTSSAKVPAAPKHAIDLLFQRRGLEDGGKSGSTLGRLFSRCVRRDKVHKDLMNRLNEVMSDPGLLTDPVAQKAASRVREKFAERGDKLQYGSVHKYLNRVVAQRNKLRGDELSEGLRDIFGKAHVNAPRIDKLLVFSASPSKDDGKDLIEMAHMMGLPEDAPEIVTFRSFVEASLTNGGQIPPATGRADVLEFARRWTAAMNSDPMPTDVCGFGNAVDDVVKVLVKGFDLGPVPEPGLDYVTPVVSSADFHKLCAELCNAVVNGEERATEIAVKKLGEKFALHLRATPRDVQTAFCASTGPRFTGQLLSMLLASAPMQQAGVDDEAFVVLKDAVANVYLGAVSDLSDTVLKMDTVQFESSLAPGKIECRTVPVVIRLKGEVYRLTTQSRWADGGFGMVGIFVSDSGKQRCALKMALPTAGTLPALKEEQSKAAFLDMVGETRMHLAASTLPHPNVASLMGAMRLPDGSLAIVSEACSNGSLDDVIQKLPDLAQTVPAVAVNVRLNLAHQVLDAMSHVHERARVAHRDVKVGNLLLAPGGLVKVIDYGSSHLNAEVQEPKGKVENPRWLDPIAAAADMAAKDLSSAIRRAAREASIGVSAAERSHVKEQSKAALEAANNLPSTVDGYAADKWSVGVVLYQIYTGELPFSDKDESGNDRHNSDIEVEAEALMRLPPDKKRTKLFPSDKAAHVPPDIQDIIIGLLDEDPAQRMNFSAAMAKDCFQKNKMLADPVARAAIDRLAMSK